MQTLRTRKLFVGRIAVMLSFRRFHMRIVVEVGKLVELLLS